MDGPRSEQIGALSLSEYCSIKENILRQTGNRPSPSRWYVEAAFSSKPPRLTPHQSKCSSVEISRTQKREGLIPLGTAIPLPPPPSILIPVPVYPYFVG